MGSFTRRVLVRVAATFGVAAAGMCVASPNAFAAGQDDYNALLSGTSLPPLCQHSTTEDYTNCLVG
ncbi:MAG TPA: hypothetical protein VGH89_17640 [Pseudonocardia sp.]|jgi:hypothetical protein